MDNTDQITVQLLNLQEQKSLMLRWHLFHWIVHSKSVAINICIHAYLSLLVAF